MATITWPPALPQYFRRDTYQEEMAKNVVVSEYEAGPSGLRRRVTANVYTVSGAMVMTTIQWAALLDFIAEETLGRELCFGFPVPGDCGSPVDEWLVLMDKPPSRSWLGEDLWRVEMSFVVLP